MKRIIYLVVILTLGLSVSNVQASIPLSLTEYATQIVGSPTTVHCSRDVPANMYGYTNQVSEIDDEGNIRTYFEPDIYLNPAICSNIRLLYYRNIKSYYWQINALETLIHESYHIRLNTRDEGLVECTAMRNLWNYLLPYGFTRAQNKRFMSAAWDAHWALAPEYLVGCPTEPETLIGFGPIPKKKV